MPKKKASTIKPHSKYFGAFAGKEFKPTPIKRKLSELPMEFDRLLGEAMMMSLKEYYALLAKHGIKHKKGKGRDVRPGILYKVFEVPYEKALEIEMKRILHSELLRLPNDKKKAEKMLSIEARKNLKKWGIFPKQK